MKQHQTLLALLGIIIVGYAGLAFMLEGDGIVIYAQARRVLYTATSTAMFIAYVYFVRYKAAQFSWHIAIAAICFYLLTDIYEMAPSTWMRHQLTTATWLMCLSIVSVCWYRLVSWEEYRVKVVLLFYFSIIFSELCRYLLLLWWSFPNHTILHPMWMELLCFTVALLLFWIYCLCLFIKRPLDPFYQHGKYVFYYRPKGFLGWYSFLWHVGGHTMFYDGTQNNGTLIRFSHSAPQKDPKTGEETGKKGAIKIFHNSADFVASSDCKILARKRIYKNAPYDHLEGLPYSLFFCNCFDMAGYLVGDAKRMYNKRIKNWNKACGVQ